jgi:hypothetical protein
LPHSEEGTEGQNRKRRQRQYGNASLQQFIKRKPENIEAEVNAKKWVRDSKRAAIPETDKGVPLAGNAQRKDQRENHNGEIDSKDQLPGANVDIDCPVSVSGMPEGLVEEAFSIRKVNVSRREAKIKPEIKH